MEEKDKETLEEFRKMLEPSDSNDDKMLRKKRFLFEKSFFCLEKIYGGMCKNQNKDDKIALSICTESKINWTNKIMYINGNFKLFQFRINIKGWIENMFKQTNKIYFVLINLSIHDLENCLLIDSTNKKVFYMFEDTMQKDSSISGFIEKNPLLDKNKIKNKKIDRPNIISYLIYLFIINEKNLVYEETSGSTGTTGSGSITKQDIFDYLVTRIEEVNNQSIENFLDFTDKFINEYYPVIFDIKRNNDSAPLLDVTQLPEDT